MLGPTRSLPGEATSKSRWKTELKVNLKLHREVFRTPMECAYEENAMHFCTHFPHWTLTDSPAPALPHLSDFPSSRPARSSGTPLTPREVGGEGSAPPRLPPAFTTAGILLPGMPIPVRRLEGAVRLGGTGSHFPAADSMVVALPGRPRIDGADLRPATTGTADHPSLGLSGERDP